MKTAISLPNQIFHDAEQYAKRTHQSRSRLFGEAISEYLARHAPDSVTETMDRVCQRLSATRDDFAQETSRRILKREEW